MNRSEIYINDKLIQLGKRIGKGGEGEVYILGSDAHYAVKIYTTSDLKIKEAKIKAMVSAGLANKSELVAFPLSIANDKNGAFMGFVMKLVDEHRPIHELYAPGSRKHHFPLADYRFLARSATNFARAVASVHKSGCVIGDINHSGILVSKKATVGLIDADSFQFSSMGSNFLCKVGVPEYTPPELQGGSLSSVVRTQNHDAFGLAIVLFQLLFMGRHPFVGSVRSGEIPPLHENIRNYRYVYTDTKNVGMDQPPGTPLVSDFSPDIAKLFDAAFLQPGITGRPSADAWIRELEKLEESLTQCNTNTLHYYPKDALGCPWCEMDKELGILLFVPYAQRLDAAYADFDPGAAGFNLQSIWSSVELIIKSVPTEPAPVLTKAFPGPSADAVRQKTKGRTLNSCLGYFLIVGAVIGFMAAPPGFIVWLLLAAGGYSLVKESTRIDAQKFTQEYISVENRWRTAMDAWERRAGLSDYAQERDQLRKLRVDYLSLSNMENQEISRYRSDRQQRQLFSFLDQFDIQNASIPGIGSGKQALLSSYGVDTAADLSLNKLLSIPGVGDVTASALMAWRSRVENRFVYQSIENESDKQEILKIRSRIEAKAGPIRRQLSAGPVNLKRYADRVIAATKTPDPALIQVQEELDQALSNLRYLGISTPVIQKPQPVAPHVATSNTSHSTNNYGGGTAQRHSGTSPLCPRCGSTMIKRLARKGRNAGNYFWGCSRYPKCKGLRNI